MSNTKGRASTAYHEAGHAVVAHYERVRYRYATIRPGEDSFGHVLFRHPGKWFQPDMEKDARHRGYIERVARVDFAGLAAEARFKGRHNWRGASHDLHDAVNLLDYICGSNEEVEAYVNLMRVQARGLVEWHWNEVQAIADALLVRERLTAAEIAEIIAAINRVKLAARLARWSPGERL